MSALYSIEKQVEIASLPLESVNLVPDTGHSPVTGTSPFKNIEAYLLRLTRRVLISAFTLPTVSMESALFNLLKSIFGIHAIMASQQVKD